MVTGRATPSREALQRFVAGHAAAEEVIREEQRQRLEGLTVEQSRAEYDSLCAVWEANPYREGLELLEQRRIEELLELRRRLDLVARRRLSRSHRVAGKTLHRGSREMLTQAGVTRVKICCIASLEEAWTAIRHGASAVGLVSEMPSGPGVISEELIAQIAAGLPPAVGSFLLTSRQDTATIIAQQRRCRTNTIQLCDRLRSGTYEQLRAAMPGISIVQVLHVAGEQALDEARQVAPHVDGLLLDSGDTSSPVKELGGTGRTHNWAISRRIRDEVDVPVFLAGGLRPENVVAAIRAVRPYGVDVCTGVRTNGHLDEAKLAAFFEGVRAA